MNLKQTLFRVSLFNFFIVGILGLLLRYAKYQPVDFFNFKFLLHAHSHFAMGGWVYLGLFSAILIQFKNEIEKNTATYKKIFWVSVIGIYGMLFSFPFQGYGLYSIILSQIYVLATYWLAYRLWKDINGDFISIKYFKTALVFLVVSSIGPYAMGPMMASKLAGSPWYYDTIYFYLHFQYNGWMSFAVYALVLRVLEERNFLVHKSYADVGWKLMTIGCILTYFLSVLWSEPGWVFNVAGGIGSLLQIVALYYAIKALAPLHNIWKEIRSSFIRLLILVSIGALLAKLFLQLVGSIQIIASIAYKYPDFIIAYLHLTFIGFISCFLFVYFLKTKMIRASQMVIAGIAALLFGFFTTEFLLVVQAGASCFSLPAFMLFSKWLFYFTVAMPLGLVVLILSQRASSGAVFRVKEMKQKNG